MILETADQFLVLYVFAKVYTSKGNICLKCDT